MSNEEVKFSKTQQITLKEKAKVIMQIVISLLSITAGLFLVITSNNEAVRELGAGWVGIVIGYWLS